jgi:hypothetical protein
LQMTFTFCQLLMNDLNHHVGWLCTTLSHVDWSWLSLTIMLAGYE